MNAVKGLRTVGPSRAALVGTLVLSCASPPPALQVAPTTALVDEPIEILADGLTPASEFAVRATTLDQRRRPWVAEARFVAGKEGSANLSEIAPLAGGSYEGVDPMGLFWSATPKAEGTAIAHRPGLVYETIVELLVDGQVIDRATVRRRFDATGLTRLDVSEDGVVGVYYRPSHEGPGPAVVVFAGSDGGLESADWRAALLASRGFAALAVALFAHPGRPDDLVEIPLEDAVAAVSWLERRPETTRIGALGFSKGSELALTLAARDPRVEAVVAISPSAYVWPGISDGPPEKRSSWTWQGKPLAFVPWAVGPRSGAMFGAGPPFRLRLLYDESLAAASPDTRAAAAIDIARVGGPVLLVSGEDDGSWPASEMAGMLVERMTTAGRPGDISHLPYPEAGHLLFWDSLPATTSERNSGQIFGGSPAANAKARAESWAEIREFLRAALGAGGPPLEISRLLRPTKTSDNGSA